MLIIIILTLLVSGVKGWCNYQTFDESQLNSSLFYGEQSYTRNDLNAFGIWTMYAPLRQNYYYDESKIVFNENKIELEDDGYHILNYKSNGVIQTLYKISRLNLADPSMGVKMTIIQLTMTSNQEYAFSFTSSLFEGYWIFMYFSFQYSTDRYNFVAYHPQDDSFHSVQETLKLPPQSTYAKLEYGGAGLYNIGMMKYNLNIFPGRISRAQIMDNPQQFTTKQKTPFLIYISKCFIPNPCTTQKEIKVLDGVYSQANLTKRDYKFDIPGQRYSIEFWIQRNSVFQMYKPEFILYYGSHLKYQTQIKQLMLYCSPNGEKMIFFIEIVVYYYYPADIASYGTTLYQLNEQFSISLDQLSQWNFICFDFYKINQAQTLTIYIYSSTNNQYYQMERFGQQGFQEFSNFQAHLTLMSSLQDSDPKNFAQFQGYIANVKMTYCHTKSPIFTDGLNLNCHEQCQTCDGPTKWDCTSCYENQNRQLLIKNICICILGYVEVDNQLICQLNKIPVPQMSSKISGIAENCQYGYFVLWNNDIFSQCLPCPLNNIRHNDCLDCLLNSQNWYLNPVCNYYYTSKDGLFFTLQQRDIVDYYTISNELKSVTYCDGCQSKDNCNQNRYQSNGKCKICSNNCVICNQAQCQKCQIGYYLVNNYCEKCISECQSCDIVDNQPQCIICPDHFTLYQGQCYRCGQFCLKCEIRFTKDDTQYVKCLQCQYQTFPSLDGVNCFANIDRYCLSPFEYSINNYSISTMIFDFEPHSKEFINSGCIFCTPSVFLNITYHVLQCQLQDITFSINGCSFPYIMYEKNFCFMGQDRKYMDFEIGYNLTEYFGIGFCFHLLPQCLYCLESIELENGQICLICEQGYYNDYYTSLCKQCPNQCATCQETDVTNVNKMQSFILFNQLYQNNLQQFFSFTQDPDKSHIYITCDSCIEGFTFYEGQCIPNCPSNCKECQIIDNQNICLSCLQLNEYSYFTIQDGKCIECPTNCKLCKLRTLEQKQQFNPYFNNQNYDLFSNLCIQPFDDSLFYDQELKQFINCNNCYKQVDFQINILCNTASQTDNFNIQLEQLFNSNQNNYFNNIEIDDYYLYLNQEYVKQINYKFIFQQNSIFQLNTDTYFTSTLQQNVFNLLYLNFILEGNNSTLILNGLITLSNFTSITISNLNIVNGGIITKNIKDYSINFENITITSLNQQNLNTFNFNNVTNVYMKYINISNMIYNNSSILAINNIKKNSKIVFQNWTIELSQFNATSIIQFNVQQLNLVFQSIFISKNTIIKSQLLQLPINNIPFLNNLTINDNIIINSSRLFQFTNNLSISQFFIINSKIINSIIIKIQAGLVFSNSQFLNLQLFGNTTLISADTFQKDHEVTLTNIIYFDILYEQKQPLLSVYKTENYHILVFISQISLQKISLNSININSNIQESIDQSLFYIECHAVELKNLSIKRGLGFPEFTILGAKSFLFSNTQISLDELYYSRSLNANKNCDSLINKSLLKSFMIVYNVQVAQFSFLNIEWIILYDSVFIDFQQSIDLNSPFIEITNCNFSSNIIHQITSQSTVSLLKISSLQGLTANLSNNAYKQNLLYIQEKINVATQGLLFNVVANSINILQNIFQQNMIINGQSSILLIESSQILIKNSNFQNNSIFQYQTLKQFLIWGFDRKVFQEDLEQLFSVASYGGNGNLKANNISIFNSSINNSYSKQGAGFALEIFENGILNVFNSTFSNLNTDMQGGCFYTQSNSINLQIDIFESNFFNINSNQQGSVIYLQTSTIVTTINFTNLNFLNIYALQGPLLYIYQQHQGNPYFQMQNCLLSNDNSKFQDFINQIQDFINDIPLTQYFSLVYFTDGMIKISNLIVNNFPLTQLFYFQNSVILKDITVINQFFTRSLFIFNKNVNALKIEIINLKIINCTQEENFQLQKNNIVQNLQTLKPTCTQSEIPESIPLYTSRNQNSIKLISQQIGGVILFQNFLKADQIYLKQIQIQIICPKCQFGILGFSNLQSSVVKIMNIIIKNSICGIYGCLHFASSLAMPNQARNLIQITNLFCSNNTAEYGGCLYLRNQQITIKDGKILNNTAKEGGAIYIEGNESILDSFNLFIINNTAKQGSGLYSINSFLYTQNGWTFFENYGQVLTKKPSKLHFEFFQNQIVQPTITYQDQQYIVSKILHQDGSEAILQVPTGIEIHKYRIFDQKNNSYRNEQQILRLYALTDTLEVQNLTNTFCNCQVIDESGKKYSRLTNKDTFYFNQSSYILDDLILYIPQDINQQFWLKFWCNSIFIPVIEDGQTKSFHQNYSLLVKIKPYKCQLGEYHVSESDYCHQCQTELQQYSVTQNSTFCSIKNDQIISEITAAQVKLNSGYWKYKLTSTTFDICLNNKDNCIGGWKYGNNLCSQGYIGALCEQCDYYNIMGNGEYEHKDRFECQFCEDSSSAKVVLLLLCTSFMQKFHQSRFIILMYVFSSLSISEINPHKNNKLKNKRFNNINEAILGQYIQIAIQFFQTISLEIELNQIYPSWLEIIIDLLGNPFQLMKIFNNCKLLDTNIRVVYLDFFQNFICSLLFVCIFLSLKFLIMLLRRKKISFVQNINFIVFYYIYFSISFIRSLLKLLSFRQIQNEYWTYQNLAYLFNVKEHLISVFAGFLPLTIVFGLLIPLLMILFLSNKNSNKAINYFGIWIIAHQNFQLVPFKILILVTNAVSLIVTDGSTALRAVFSFIVLLIYYSVTNFQPTYINIQQNNFEQSLMIISMYLVILSAFHKVVNIRFFESLIQIIIFILFIVSCVLIIQKIINTKFIIKIKRRAMRFIAESLPSLSIRSSLFHQYSQEKEAQHQKRIQKLKEYILNQGRLQINLSKKLKNIINPPSQI